MSSLEKDPEKYKLTEKRHEYIFQTKIKPKIFRNLTRCLTPTAIIFGGQPGSGKSISVDFAVQELKLNGGCALIVGDEFRDYHPEYNNFLLQDDKTAAFFTDRDTARWVEKSIAYAKEIKCNLVIEGTMRIPEKVAETMKSLREAGYKIEARVLAVNERLSWQGVLQRYENQHADRGFGRMTTPDAHQAGYNGMLNTLELIETEKLADKIIIYKRSAIVLYENELENWLWKHEPLARITAEKERNRKWILPGMLEYANNFESLFKLIKRPERNASFEEINAIQNLKNQAYVELNNENNSFFASEAPMLALKASMKDPYVYENSNVLINKFNIQDASQLEEVEKSIFMYKFDHPLPEGNFDYNHLKAIHKHFFEGLYDWAGNERTVDISKGNSYFDSHEFIEKALEKIFTQLARVNYLKDFPFGHFTRKLSYYFNEINAAHPFREGNGRTLRAFCSLLSEQAGYHLQWENTDRQTYIQANIFGFEGQNEAMENIFQKICSKDSIALKAIHDNSKDKQKPTDICFEEDVILKKTVSQKKVKFRRIT